MFSASSKLALGILLLSALALVGGCPKQQAANPAGNPLETPAGKASQGDAEDTAPRGPVNTGGLAGRWQTGSAQLEIELRKDGTYIEQTAGNIDPSGSTQGAYEVMPDGRLKLSCRIQGVELNRFYEFTEQGDILRIRMVEMSNQHAKKTGDQLQPSAAEWKEWTRVK